MLHLEYHSGEATSVLQMLTSISNFPSPVL